MVKIFTMVKGESDIVEDWVLYHGTIVGYQNIFIIDNFSFDGTFEILLNLQKKYNINLIQLPDYKKKGQYMTFLLKKYGKNDIVFPIDIDEFIVYYDKPSNLINCDKSLILNYISSLPEFPVFKMNYIQSKILEKNGYNKATIESSYGKYDNCGSFAKTFFNSKLFKGEIDHGNHYNTNNYILTKLCLLHFHTRNLEQIKKKVYNNVKGLGYNPFDYNSLKKQLIINSNCEGFHHVIKQIKILENNFNIDVEEKNIGDVDLIPFNNYVKSLF